MKKRKSIDDARMKGYIKICPNCGSTDVSVESFNYMVRDLCKECGYGSIKESVFVNDLIYFPEIPEEDIEEFRKEVIQKKKKDKKED
jgi:ribosomal protein S27AE